ncbi:hypothetical protein KXX63_002251 [Aspergillus fumigatus]|nr:hypothetical protein KXX63_002251 [Aspergillus fumigatus]KAH2491689.1 hypothetical protein KXW70_004880 [Aspergillus fumigatus]
MATFRKAITARPSPWLHVMTPPGSPPWESFLRDTDKEDLKQLLVNAIREVLAGMPVEATSAMYQPTTASLLTDLLEVLQPTSSSGATAGPSRLASVGAEKDNHCQLPLDSQVGAPPNSPCITPLETVARMDHQKESTDLLVPSTDDPSAYSIYAEEPRDTAGDCKVAGKPKLPVTDNDVDVASLPNVGPLNDGQSTPNTVDIDVTNGERPVAGARVSDADERETQGVSDIKKDQYKCSSGPFGTSTPQFNAYELESLLANAAKTRNWADSPDTADGLDLREARGIESKDLRGDRQGIPYSEVSHIPSEPVTMDQLKDLFQAVLDCKPQTAFSGTENGPAGPEKKAENNQDSDAKRILASRMEYKTVNEAYDSKAYEYKIVDSPPPQDVSELDEFVFVVRRHIQKHTHNAIIYVDIKSTGLRDILRCVLKDVRTAGLEADKPAVERNLSFHFLPELKIFGAGSDDDISEEESMRHLTLLIKHLEEAYESTTGQMSSLLTHRKITYDLLWAFFKPGALLYLTCPSTGLPQCVRYSCGKETKTVRKGDCFEIQCQYFDYDGEVFGQSTEILQIEMFSGARRIENLPAYPLEFHPDPEIWSRLVSAGRKFVSLIGCYHQNYEGNMPHTNMFGQILDHKIINHVQSNSIDPGELKEEELAICSPTVLSFSLNKKIWGEFAIEEVAEIQFSNAPFDMLAIPEDKKKVIKSLTESRVRATTEGKFDDIIKGKGQGVIILLHPPGVGKTLTAEAISERLQQPLYSISAGDLSAHTKELKVQLTRTFRVASNWKAVLLLDKADIYLQQQDGLHLERNRLVATFLRTLKYYPSIFFLTTNMLQDFDAAILNQIQLKLQYHNLDSSAQQAIFRHFSAKIGAEISEDEIRNFAEVSLNGRQIKNIIKLAHNVAMSDGVPLRANHIQSALRANGYTIPTPGSTIDNNLYDD